MERIDNAAQKSIGNDGRDPLYEGERKHPHLGRIALRTATTLPMMYLSYYYKKPAKASICLLRAFSSRAGTFIHAANFFISNLRMHIFRLRICISNLRMCISSLKIKNLCGKAGFASRMNTICRPHEIKVKFRQAPCFFAFPRLILCRQFC